MDKTASLHHLQKRNFNDHSILTRLGLPDNATFHYGGRIAELIEAKGAQLVYLPPYLPDLNRIEKCWAWLKSRIRKQQRNLKSLREAMETVLKEAVSYPLWRQL